MDRAESSRFGGDVEEEVGNREGGGGQKRRAECPVEYGAKSEAD